MSFNDYMTQFIGSTICKYNESFHRDNIKFTHHPSTFSMFTFSVAQESTVHLMVYQTYERIAHIVDQLYEYSRVHILVAREETNQLIKQRFPLEYIGGTYGR